MKKKNSLFEYIGMFLFVVLPPVGMYLFLKLRSWKNDKPIMVVHYFFIISVALYWGALIGMGDISFLSILISNLCVWVSLLIFMVEPKSSDQKKNNMIRILGSIMPILISLLLFLYSSAYTSTLSINECGLLNKLLLLIIILYVSMQFTLYIGKLEFPCIFEGLPVNNETELDWMILRMTALFPLLLVLPFLNEKLPNYFSYLFCFHF